MGYGGRAQVARAGPHNRTVLDPGLVGYWSDEVIYQGAFQAGTHPRRTGSAGGTGSLTGYGVRPAILRFYQLGRSSTKRKNMTCVA